MTPTGLLFNSLNKSKKCANCCMRVSVIALVCRATSSDVTGALTNFSTSWWNNLSSVFLTGLSVSLLLSKLSVSVPMVLFLNYKATLRVKNLIAECGQIFVFWVGSSDEMYLHRRIMRRKIIAEDDVKLLWLREIALSAGHQKRVGCNNFRHSCRSNYLH